MTLLKSLVIIANLLYRSAQFQLMLSHGFLGGAGLGTESLIGRGFGVGSGGPPAFLFVIFPPLLSCLVSNLLIEKCLHFYFKALGAKSIIV